MGKKAKGKKTKARSKTGGVTSKKDSFRLAEECSHRGDYASAQEHCTRALGNPAICTQYGKARIYLHRMNANWMLCNYEKVLQDADRLLAIDSCNQSFIIFKIEALIRCRSYAEVCEFIDAQLTSAALQRTQKIKGDADTPTTDTETETQKETKKTDTETEKASTHSTLPSPAAQAQAEQTYLGDSSAAPSSLQSASAARIPLREQVQTMLSAKTTPMPDHTEQQKADVYSAAAAPVVATKDANSGEDFLAKADGYESESGSSQSGGEEGSGTLDDFAASLCGLREIAHQQKLYDDLYRMENTRVLYPVGPSEEGKPSKGFKGVFAQRGLSKRSSVWTEKPLLCTQKPTNKLDVLACEHCLRFLGMWKKPLSSPSALPSFPLSPHLTPSPSKEPVRCPNGCASVYCSEECARQALSSHHRLLCVSSSGVDLSSVGQCESTAERAHALQQLEQFANETTWRFHLASRIIASAVYKYQQLESQQSQSQSQSTKSTDSSFPSTSSAGPSHHQTTTASATATAEAAEGDPDLLSKAVHPYSMFCSARWENFSQYDPQSGLSEHNDNGVTGMDHLAKIKGGVIDGAMKLLRKALFYEACRPLFSVRYLSRLLGMMDMNVTDVEAFPDPTQRKSLSETLGCSLDEIPTSIGSGLFLRHSCLNHSCRPNCTVIGGLLTSQCAEIRIEVKRDIPAGEELVISYIDEQLPLMHRQSALQGSYL
eukprot:CAMPEP_0177629572 /NCGR_PEP_ID=MMETSP0447-20121125/741_1 /TAXON_ID=0 /ORGANISM="Stygamoeba regulata, Strain BSH-02190019" /LENGTH=713 /DNA_ID=CAMNT_0019130905 /DNA_START=36 /DNA_END=2174 /DNA_ORIENTATION=+